MVDCVREMTVMQSCEHLLSLVDFIIVIVIAILSCSVTVNTMWSTGCCR